MPEMAKDSTTDPKATPNYLDTDVSRLQSVASRRLSLLHKLEIYTVYDLLTYFPRGYQDWTHLVPIVELKDGQEQSFSALVRQKPSIRRKGRLSIVRSVLSDESGTIRVVWFNQPYIATRIKKDETYLFRGRVRRDGTVFAVTNPALESADEGTAPGLKPVYALTAGLTQGFVRTLISGILPQGIMAVQDILPPDLRRREQLCTAAFAYEKIHQPSSDEDLQIAAKRLIYEELFLVQGGLRWFRRQTRTNTRAYPLSLTNETKAVLEEAILRLPFRLTEDQRTVIEECKKDMSGGIPMNRLVQGDVGSGKTAVAMIAMLYAALGGGQSVLMAPTSILATQHMATISRFLEGTGVEAALLLGSTPAAEKRRIREKLLAGQIHLLIGTHAVLGDGVVFRRLALTVTDEQHRFGVRQRAAFFDRDNHIPHTLVMSATPIPRTLALILYGDLDISIIHSIPAGRIPVETYTAEDKDEERLFGIVRRQVEAGHQVYWICPTIAASEADNDAEENKEEEEERLLSAEELYARLSGEVFPNGKVGLLHGGMKPSEKDLIMRRFLSGEISILVATTVVEVGVDNPNATLMIIENAERFGLSQLHQLRGRVGRGANRSICVLKSAKKEGLAKERLKAVCSTTDGFLLAQKDLELRGPGDFFGTRQHGIPALRIANLFRDTDVLARVSLDLERIFREDPDLTMPPHAMLPKAFIQRFGSEIEHPSL